MNFSANELNNYSAINTQNSQKTFDSNVVVKAPMQQDAPHTKDFFEQIYDHSVYRHWFHHAITSIFK